ncbi:DUF2087 domain-containing protein [Amaricoccus sp.]|uniref:DUF2087 domain-containing protein n=1 Tax=Amaricoccus sp. TaxID=1872485 RepID=UPI001B4E8819|nr:DUF2087 domain-containing protein [Amaricoccus sp.]MBP7001192.1 DUF2087 domain-containing protein [Amaricoccus sp.]
MPRNPIPLATGDVSAFARALSAQLRAAPEPPGHLTLLNMLARAGGFRNFQHLRAADAAAARLAAPPPVPETLDHRLVERALRLFDAGGRLLRWPSRRGMQDLCLWPLWARLPAERELHERDVNAILREATCFDDPAILRRTLFDLGRVTRRRDGAGYRRLEIRPPAEARALIRHVESRRASRPS